MAKQIATEVTAELGGQRLDKIVAALHGVSRSQARQLIEQGVTVDDVPGRPSDRIEPGAIIVTPTLDADDGLAAEAVDFDVLFEDGDVIVVDKPPGIVAHPGSGRTSGTLAAGLLHRFPEIEGVGSAHRWGMIHRLDKDTSGAILVARTRDSFDELSRQLRNREIRRVYTTLVEGVPGSPTGAIEAPIGRDTEHPTRRAVVQGGKYAKTHFEIEDVCDAAKCALLRVRLETGRTHQIRVHLSAIGHPVIGDETYGKGRSPIATPRMFLHASSITFVHPRSGEPTEVIAPLPADLRSVLETLDLRVTA